MSHIDFKDLMEFYKDYTKTDRSLLLFIICDFTFYFYLSDNPLKFSKKLFKKWVLVGKLKQLIMI